MISESAAAAAAAAHFQIYENISRDKKHIVYAAPHVEAAGHLLKQLRCERAFISDVATLKSPPPSVVAVVEHPVTYFLKGYVTIRYFGGLRFSDRLRKLSHATRWMIEKGPSLKVSLEAAVQHAQKKNGGPYNVNIAPQHLFFGVKGTGAFDYMLSSGISAICRVASARDVRDVDRFIPAEALLPPTPLPLSFDSCGVATQPSPDLQYGLQRERSIALEKINSLFAKDSKWAAVMSARILRAYDVDAYYHMCAVNCTDERGNRFVSDL